MHFNAATIYQGARARGIFDTRFRRVVAADGNCLVRNIESKSDPKVTHVACARVLMYAHVTPRLKRRL